NYRPGLVPDLDRSAERRAATKSRRLRRELAGGRYGQRLGARDKEGLLVIAVDTVVRGHPEVAGRIAGRHDIHAGRPVQPIRKCHAVGMEEDPNGGAGDGERLVPGPVQASNYRPGLVPDLDIVTDIAVATTSRRLRRELAGGRYGQRLGARNAQHLSIVLVDCVILRYRERRARRRW